MLIITRNFVGHGYNMLDIGTKIDPPAELADHLVKIGVAARLETKVDPIPPEAKKNEPSDASQAAPVAPKQTRKASRKKSKR